MNKPNVLALLAAVLLAATLGAADTELELELEQIVVTATRTATTILDSPDHVTVISGEEIAASGALSLADALQQVAGLEIKDYGTAGSLKSVRIRGSAPSQVLILVDGVRVNDSWQGLVDLSQLSVENIERIEILRGGTSALYGADAMGGVVNIITKSHTEKRFTFTIINGSYLPHDAIQVSESSTAPVGADYLDLVDTQRVGLQASGVLGSVDLIVAGSFTRAANGYVWNDQQYIDDYRRQFNADLLDGNASLSLTTSVGPGKMGLKGQFDYSSAGAPGSLTLLSTDAAQQRAAFQGQLFYSNPQLAGSALSLEAHLFYKYTRLAYQNPDPFPAWAADDVHILNSLGLELQQQATLADLLQLVYGGNFVVDLVDSTAAGKRRRLSGGGFIEVPFYMASRLTLIPMVRYDLNSDFPASLTYKLAAVLNLSENASLKASGGKSYRTPTMQDLYYPFGSNPDIQPETGYSGDLGLSVVMDRLEANLFAFVRYVLDGIVVEPPLYLPQNFGRVLYPGAEADVSVELIPGLHLSGSYTFLYSYILQTTSTTYSFADNKRAIYTPVHTASAAVKYDNGRTRLGLDAQIVGERFSDQANSIRVDGYLVLNAEARQRLSPNLTLTLAGKNLLNRVYQTWKDYVMPPLSFWVGAELRL